MHRASFAIFILASSSFFAVLGCRRGEPDVDAGRDAGRGDASTEEPDVGPVVEALDYAATVAALVAGPLVPDAGALDTASDAATDATIRERVESGVATSSIVDDAACTSFAWAGRVATITFTGCTSESTGLAIDGTVTFSVTLRPTTFTVTFDDLSIGGTRIGGDVTLVVSGAAGARSYTVDADLAWTDGTTSSAVVLSAISVVPDATAGTTTLDGAFTLTTGSVTASGTIDGLIWRVGDCHPSGGSASFSSDGGPTIVVTFLASTPASGTVSVQIPPLPAADMVLLEPCGA